MDTNTATLEAPSSEDILHFIDEWLDENGWKIDGTVLDFALDVRSLIEDCEEDAPSN